MNNIAGKSAKKAVHGNGKKKKLPDCLEENRPKKDVNVHDVEYPSGMKRKVSCLRCEAFVRDDGVLSGGKLDHYFIDQRKGTVEHEHVYCNCEVGYFLYRVELHIGRKVKSIAEVEKFYTEIKDYDELGWQIAKLQVNLFRKIGKPNRMLEKAIKNHEQKNRPAKTD